MSPRVLLLGGHGKVSMLMTPLLLQRSWQVTSIVRNPDHEADIKSCAEGKPGELDFLVRSLDDVQSEKAAQSIIDESKPDYVVWSAGAGGKGGASRTYAIDRDAAVHFIHASVHTPSIKKFLLVSFPGSRRNRPAWYTDEDWAYSEKVRTEVLPDYTKAKIVADEALTSLATQRGGDFQGICLRPGTLSDDPATGKIKMGKIHPQGKVSRADVADVAVRLLERDDARGYFDFLNGDEDIDKVIDRVIKDKEDTIEGEDVDAIMAKYKI